MKVLYIDAAMGAAGDMLTGALLELIPDKENFIKELNALGLPGVEFCVSDAKKCGITGTHVEVLINGEAEGHFHVHDKTEKKDCTHEHHAETAHSHNNIEGISHIVSEHLNIPENVKKDILEVFNSIAEAESKVHRIPVDEIHFHEVGSLDAIADVTAVCMLMDRVHPDKVIVSPVNTGSGFVKCMHGTLPVPAPATAELLKGLPVFSNEIKSELCTPTGAALLKHFADETGSMPVMKVEKTGYGMGKKDFDTANCIRVFEGSTEEALDNEDEVIILSCNLDDMTGEKTGYVMEKLFENGALDVCTKPIGMKKCRPGIELSVMCREEDKDIILKTMFKLTTTIGIREEKVHRYKLTRHEKTADTAYGPVRLKISEGFGVKKTKYEYDDLKQIADRCGMSLEEAEEQLLPDKKSF